MEITRDFLYNLYHIENKSAIEIGNIIRKSDSTVYRLFEKFDIPRKDKTRNSAGWNRGKTKETDGRVRLNAERTSKTRKEMFKSGEIVHHNLNKQQPIEVKTKISNSLKGKLVGDKNPNWKGGSKNEYKVWRRRIHDSLEYRELRRKVFERDSYTCQMCFKVSQGDLEMHHIKEVYKFPNLILEESNCISLCENCHSSIKNKEERFEEMFNERVQSKVIR